MAKKMEAKAEAGSKRFKAVKKKIKRIEPDYHALAKELEEASNSFDT